MRSNFPRLRIKAEPVTALFRPHQGLSFHGAKSCMKHFFLIFFPFPLLIFTLFFFSFLSLSMALLPLAKKSVAVPHPAKRPIPA